MPLLRGHHLICLHFFNGEGYSDEFIRNLKLTIGAVRSGTASICPGADDICRKCPSLINDKCHHTANAEEEIIIMDSRALELLGLSSGGDVCWNSIKDALPEVFSRWYGSYCIDCEWLKICEKSDNFRRLRSEAILKS